ncbi:MAG: hypothetical protein WD294_02215 [Phycisphaeraceae bacterium]
MTDASHRHQQVEPYARCQADEPDRPVYKPTDDFLEFKRSVRLAAIDVMILAFATRHHAQWLNRIGVCPPDIAELIAKDLDAVRSILPASPESPDVGPSAQAAAAGERRKTSPRNATRRNVGQRRQADMPLFSANLQEQHDGR